jgi:WD40 repeat protein
MQKTLRTCRHQSAIRTARLARPLLTLFSLVAMVIALGALSSRLAAEDAPKLEIVPEVGHTSGVRWVGVSPDAKVLVSAGESIKLWDIPSRRLIRTLHPDGAVNAGAFSNGGRYLTTGSDAGTIEIWAIETGRMIRRIAAYVPRPGFDDTHSMVNSIAYSPDEKRLLAAMYEVGVRLWNPETGSLLKEYPVKNRTNATAFSPDGSSIVSGGDTKTLTLWDAETRQRVRDFSGHTGSIASLAFSNDGTSIASGSEDKSVKIWDAKTGRTITTLTGHARTISSVAFSPDNTKLVTASLDGTIKVWLIPTGALWKTIELGAPVMRAVFLSDGDRLAVAAGQVAALWNLRNDQVEHIFAPYQDAIRAVAVSSDGRQLLAGGDGLQFWDLEAGRLRHAVPGHASPIHAVAITADGRRGLSASGAQMVGRRAIGNWFSLEINEKNEHTVKTWDLLTGKLLRTWPSQAKEVRALAVSRDGRLVFSGGNDLSADAVLEAWAEGSDKQLLATRMKGLRAVYALVRAHGGVTLYAGGDDTIQRVELLLAGGPDELKGHKARVAALALSKDERKLVSGSFDTTVKLWDALSTKPLLTLKGHQNRVNAVAFAANDSRIVSGSADRSIRVWNAGTGALLRTLMGHEEEVEAVAAVGGSRHVVSGSRDGTLRVWNLETGAQVAILVARSDGGWIAMTPDGFFNAGGGGTAYLNVIKGLNVTAIDQVHQSLFNPDLVREVLAGDPDGEVRRAASVVNLDKVLESGPAPTVLLVAPARSATDIVTVQARVTDTGKGVGRMEWRVNGITAAVAAQPPGSGPVYTVTRNLPLDPGDNAIELVAYNAANLLASVPARAAVKFTGSADKAKPKLHILAIGINAYVDNGWTPPGTDVGFFFEPLDLAVEDAKAFAAAIEKAAADLYGEVRVTLALDGQATRANLPNLVDKIAAQMQPRDSFILFAAAHGYSRRGRFYLIPQDYQGGINPEALAGRAIGQDQLQDWLANRITAKRALILLDTCESGALIAGYARSRIDAPASEAAVGRLHEAIGRPVLTAAAVGQSAHEGVIGDTAEEHGYFTWAVLDALRHGDSNGDGLIALSELVAHVQTVVPKIAAKHGGGGQAVVSAPTGEKQTARFGSRGEDFVIARRLP